MDVREAPLPQRIGRYRIERLIGRGAMGRVLLARNIVLDREVAVKLLRDDLALEPEQLRSLVNRMRQEAKACARVGHPHIVQLFDMGEEPNLGLYLVFEYANGTTLKDRLHQGQLQPGPAGDIAREIGDALSTAHESGVLHRDVKPENIILTPQGSKIADFGIARVPDSTLTKNGGLLGTPAYSAPECIAHGEFSAQSDQFSLAATLYEALSRRRAFPGEDAVSVAARITNEEPPGIAVGCGLDPHVDGVLARALSKDPEKRFASAREFGDALAEALGRRSRGARPTLPDERHEVEWRAEPRAGARLLVGGVAAGALLGITGIQVTADSRSASMRPWPDPGQSSHKPSLGSPTDQRRDPARRRRHRRAERIRMAARRQGARRQRPRRNPPGTPSLRLRPTRAGRAIPMRVRDEAARLPRSRCFRELGVAIAALFLLLATVPSLSHARLREARSPRSALPVERASTGGLVTLRAPGSRMIRVPSSVFVMGSSSEEVTAATASCADEPLGHRCTESTFSDELPRIAASVTSFCASNRGHGRGVRALRRARRLPREPWLAASDACWPPTCP